RFARFLRPRIGEVKKMSSRITIIGFSSLLALLSGTLSGCEGADSCKTKQECVRQGKCTPDPKGVCIVASNEDCKASEPCKLKGKCTAQQGACVVTSDDDCKAS